MSVSWRGVPSVYFWQLQISAKTQGDGSFWLILKTWILLLVKVYCSQQDNGIFFFFEWFLSLAPLKILYFFFSERETISFGICLSLDIYKNYTFNSKLAIVCNIGILQVSQKLEAFFWSILRVDRLLKCWANYLKLLTAKWEISKYSNS